MKGWDFIVNGRDVLWQVKIYYERSRLYYEWSRILCWQIKIPGRDFHNGCLRSSWWQVDSFMTGQDFVVKGQDFHDDRSKCCYECSNFSCWFIISLSKFRSARGRCSHMPLAYPCHWAESCWCFLSVFGKNGKFCCLPLGGGSLYGKTAAQMDGETEVLFSFWLVHWMCYSFLTARGACLE